MTAHKDRYAGIDVAEARAVSDKAKELLEQRGLTLNPVNYLVAYEYCLGQDAELVREMDQHVARGNHWNDEFMAMLFDRLIEARQEERYSEMSDELMKLLSDIHATMAGTSASVGGYREMLAEKQQVLQGSLDKSVLSGIVTDLVAATHTVATEAATLQDQLDSTRDEVRTLRQQLAEIKNEADIDTLTGALNRRAMDRTLDGLMIEAASGGRSFCMLMADIDHFKNFNDNYGHQLGDEVLRRVGQVIHQQIKGGDFAARYGGEEFMVMLPDTPLQGGLKVAEDIRHAVEHIVLVRRSTKERLSKVTISVGVGEFRPGENKSEMIERVDAALYKAKHAGRNQVLASD
jgi:diguanylate cyclase